VFVEIGLWLVVQFGFDDRRRWRSRCGATAILRERFAWKHEVVFLAARWWSGRTLLALGPAILEARLTAAIVEAAIWRATAIIAIAVSA
jgi:hypothetical protein